MYFLAWVDIALAAFLMLSMLIGLLRGFVFEVLSLVGWFVAYFAAQALSPTVQPWVQLGEPGSALNHGLAFASVFVIVIVLWSLSARLLRGVIRATPLSAIDRLLGAGFGVLRGLVVLLFLAAVVGMSSLRQTQQWQMSQGAVWLNAALQGLKPVLPAEMVKLLPA